MRPGGKHENATAPPAQGHVSAVDHIPHQQAYPYTYYPQHPQYQPYAGGPPFSPPHPPYSGMPSPQPQQMRCYGQDPMQQGPYPYQYPPGYPGGYPPMYPPPPPPGAGYYVQQQPQPRSGQYSGRDVGLAALLTALCCCCIGTDIDMDNNLD
ncbi:hypothetical protein EGW08_012811 [Elysia chlorotica]|uniref:Cysteine-rich transmembrane CYSTM domain-containing protein n=1 Tax=Elysia chlorotica TaxID=188477 RepID=A0A433TDB9_ELYCH|nr:hypothetical protein EGW08_012811 [Elysia chlorotica]